VKKITLFLKANEIISKSIEAQSNFQFKSKLQVTNQSTGTTKHGDPYLILTLRDTTSELRRVNKWISSKMELEYYRKLFEIGNILEIEGTFSKEYGSISIDKVRELSITEINLDDFVISPKIDEKELIKVLNETISNIKNEKLKSLLEIIFNDNDVKTKFIECPSSVEKHHPYKYGNLEHTIGMIKIFENLEAFYNRNTNLDVDLIYTGIILHDIGKIYEYYIYNGIPKTNPEYSLIEHLILGDQLVLKFIKEIRDFPKDLENRIRHLILSHHGRKEWGSPIEPQFPEAEILHYLDMIDSRFKLN